MRRKDRVDQAMRTRAMTLRAIGSRTGRGAMLAAGALAAAPASARAAEELVLIPEIPMLVFLILLFLALIFPINHLIFKPIFHALDERASRIAGARQRAEHISAEADAVLARYEAAIQEARTAAEASRKELVAAARDEQSSIAKSARSDAEALVEKARTDLASGLEEARAGLRATSEELGRLAAERILGRAL